MIKGTPSDFHLNYNLTLIFPLFISHFLQSGFAASVFVPSLHLHLFSFCSHSLNFLLCSPFPPFFASWFLGLFSLSFWLYLWKLKAMATVTKACVCTSSTALSMLWGVQESVQVCGDILSLCGEPLTCTQTAHHLSSYKTPPTIFDKDILINNMRGVSSAARIELIFRLWYEPLTGSHSMATGWQHTMRMTGRVVGILGVFFKWSDFPWLSICSRAVGGIYL